ncbi:MAG TPA: hypothetical protein VK425_04665, partial [Acidimicrobiales bacterium]|nr:hypothetical protein [Acidimicrobiales bacterium]
MTRQGTLRTSNKNQGRKRSLGAGVACTTLAATAALMGLSPTVASASPVVTLQFWNTYNPVGKPSEVSTMQGV